MSEFIVVIPARYASERLPGKPLRMMAGKTMLQHVYARGSESSATQVIVATDDQRVADAADEFGAEVCLTSTEHNSGTERLAEVSRIMNWKDDQVVVNLQGDEPLMPAVLIDQCAGLLDDGQADMATLASPLESEGDLENPNVVKVVVDDRSNALYFSRAAIPYSRSTDTKQLAIDTALHHHGIYAYRASVLREVVAAPQNAIEQCERLEQLRALGLGLSIRVGRPTIRPGPGVDTEDDLMQAEIQLGSSSYG